MNDLLYGTRRQGKSTLGLALAVERSRRVVIFDPNGQYPVIQAIRIDDLPNWLADSSAALIENPRGYHVVRVGPFDTEYVPIAFDQFSEVLYQVNNLSVIVDEAHMLQGPQSLDPNLDRWNRRSPASVTVIQTTHRIVDAHPDSRYHADNVFFFFTDNELELKTISKHFGAEVSKAVPTLGLHQVLHWWREKGGFRRWSIWKDGGEWFIDLENENRMVENAQ
jgi:hypothetical protein